MGRTFVGCSSPGAGLRWRASRILKPTQARQGTSRLWALSGGSRGAPGMPDFELLEKEMRREMFDMQELMNRKMQEMDKKFMEDVFDTRAMESRPGVCYERRTERRVVSGGESYFKSEVSTYSTACTSRAVPAVAPENSMFSLIGVLLGAAALTFYVGVAKRLGGDAFSKLTYRDDKRWAVAVGWPLLWATSAEFREQVGRALRETEKSGGADGAQKRPG